MNALPPRDACGPAQEHDLRRLLAAERWRELETAAQHVLACRHDPDAAAALAYALVAQGRLDEADTSIVRWLERYPDDPRLLALRSEIRLQQGKGGEALRDAERAAVLAPEESAVWIALGEACDAAGEMARAEEAFLDALTCGEQAAPVYRALAFARRRHRIGAFVDALRAVENLRPLLPAEACCLGLLLSEAGDAKAAASAFRYAVGISADLPPSLLIAAADVIAEAGSREEALDLYSRAAALRPDDHDLALKRVAMLRDLERSTDALRELERILPELPEDRVGYAHATKAHLHSRQGEHRQALQALERFDAAPGEKTFAELAMVINLEAYATADAGRLLARARAVGRAAAGLPRCPLLLRRASGQGPRRLRVGLVSNGFGRHPVGWLTLPAFEAMDRSRFEIICFSTLERACDPLANRFRLLADEYVVLEGMTLPAAANEILRRGVDVLIDLQGYSAQSMPELIVRKPAPLVVKWVGMQAYSYGLDAIDAMLADDLEVPPELEHFYTERIIRLDGSYVCYLPPDPAPPVASLPFDRNGYITFGFFNNLQKLTDDWLAAAGEILRQVPGSRLLVKTRGLGDCGARERFLRRMADGGIDPNRVVLAGKTAHDRHLAAIGDADIALDSFPYTGGLTTLECAFMGVPVVSVHGTSFASRHSLSHLSRLGLGDLCAPEVQGFISRAVALASDLPRLRRLRHELRRRLVDASGLCDGRRVARSLEHALRQLTSAVHDPRPRALCQPVSSVMEGAPEEIVREAVAIRQEALHRHPDIFDPIFSIDEESLRVLIALLAKFRPSRVLEFGSGLSTLVISRLRRALGIAAFTSIDHWETWQHKVAHSLGEESRVEFVHLPIAPTSHGGLSGSFYQGILERCATRAPFDVVYIDGPTEVGGTGECNRAMAGSVFRRLLRPGAMIVLDDALRETEQQAAALWLREGLVSSWTILPSGRGIGFGELRTQ